MTTPAIIPQPVSRASSAEFEMRPIIDSVCALLRVTEKELRGNCRNKRMAESRHIASWLARRYTKLSLDEIGDVIGHRDHTTILYGVRTVEKKLIDDDWTIRVVTFLESELKQKLTLKS